MLSNKDLDTSVNCMVNTLQSKIPERFLEGVVCCTTHTPQCTTLGVCVCVTHTPLKAIASKGIAGGAARNTVPPQSQSMIHFTHNWHPTGGMFVTCLGVRLVLVYVHPCPNDYSPNKAAEEALQSPLPFPSLCGSGGCGKVKAAAQWERS